MSERMKLACEVVGILLVVAGVALLSIPVAVIVAGLSLILLGNIGGDA